MGSPAALTREELIRRVTQLEKYVGDLRLLLGNRADCVPSPKLKKLRRQGRELDFQRFKQRRVAFKIAYFGWHYDGLALQATSDNTVLSHFTEGLKRAKLIQDMDLSYCLTACGRTDKGVSAMGNVVSVNVRSNLEDPKGVIEGSGSNIHERTSNKSVEMDYPLILNGVLPKTIRVLGWAQVPNDFSARFNCTGRSYSYFFPRSGLNVNVMREAAQKLVGLHDFRHFAKFSPDHKTYTREIFSVNISKFNLCSQSSSNDLDSCFDVMELAISGSGFLYHQIRNIVAVLYLIGSGREKAELIDHLLDVTANPEKPQYVMADDFPLLFTGAHYPDLKWEISEEATTALTKSLLKLWTQHSVKACIVHKMAGQLPVFSQRKDEDLLLAKIISSEILHYKKKFQGSSLLDRPTIDNYDKRLDKVTAKRKLKEESEECASGRTAKVPALDM